jgi:ABC-type branched-subunit amino acid transport system ATPase component
MIKRFTEVDQHGERPTAGLRRRRKLVLMMTVCALASGLALAACGSSSSNEASGGGGENITYGYSHPFSEVPVVATVKSLVQKDGEANGWTVLLDSTKAGNIQEQTATVETWKRMTLRDNLRIGGASVADTLALFPELGKRLGVRGGLLSGGEQQMLTLARAFGRKPKLLLADELSLGLAPLVVDRLLQAVRSAADEQGTAVVMVEQHAHKALKYTDHALVIRRGRISLDLSGEQARSRIGEVEQAYLTSAGGDIEAGEADLAAEHAGRSAENNSAGLTAALAPMKAARPAFSSPTAPLGAAHSGDGLDSRC